MVRKILIGLGALFGLVLIGAIGAVFWLRSSLPQTDGSMKLVGLDAEIEVLRDKNGIPHILAQSEHDAYFALGVVHAQDRLWQMETNRRIPGGQLSELLGAATVSTDKFMRTMGLCNRAEKALASLDDQTLGMLDAYAEGVNAYMEKRSGALPVEFVMVRAKFAPWRPVDSLCFLKLMALSLSENWSQELARVALVSQLGIEAANEFIPPYPGDAPFTHPELATLYGDALKPIQLGAVETPLPGLGSNNWVVSGDHTRSGKPLLANDPHLGLSIPSIWYLAHIRIGERNFVGATFPGVPFIVLGRNDRLAWGFTNTGPDTQDIVLERMTPDGDGHVTPDGIRPVTTRTEIIKVRGKDPVELTVRETGNGPIISDVFPQIGDQLNEGYAAALRWTALGDTDTTVASGRLVMMAEDWDTFREAGRKYVGPQQNIVYADVDGNIAYLAPAHVPLRDGASATSGSLPARGWEATDRWQGLIPFEALPQSYNPATGKIVTANHKIVDDDYGFFLSRDWSSPYRANRIEKLLNATKRHDVTSFRAIQTDTVSQMALDVRDAFLALGDYPDVPAEMIKVIARWQGNMAADEVAPLLVSAWHRAFEERLYKDDLGQLFPQFYRYRPQFILDVLSGSTRARDWCDDQENQDVAESCHDIATQSLLAAIEDLEIRLGGGWKSWSWGQLHLVSHPHRPFHEVPQLRRFFSREAPINGGAMTVNVQTHRISSREPYNAVHAAGLRAIYDLADLDASQFMITTGQSGNLFSRHYDDLVTPYVAGSYVTIPTKDQALAQMKLKKLTITPARTKR
ncbi:MAG: penicillin acylase family protein [Pseudomonadota bacterium]